MGGLIEFLVKYGEQIGLPLPSAPLLWPPAHLVGFRRLNVFEVLTLAVAASVICPSMFPAWLQERGILKRP